jgi:hypothetical protein
MSLAFYGFVQTQRVTVERQIEAVLDTAVPVHPCNGPSRKIDKLSTNG